MEGMRGHAMLGKCPDELRPGDVRSGWRRGGLADPDRLGGATGPLRGTGPPLVRRAAIPAATGRTGDEWSASDPLRHYVGDASFGRSASTRLRARP